MSLFSHKKTLNFEAIIGGAENPRFTAQIATASGEEGVPDPEIGVKTEKINKLHKPHRYKLKLYNLNLT